MVVAKPAGTWRYLAPGQADPLGLEFRGGFPCEGIATGTKTQARHLGGLSDVGLRGQFQAHAGHTPTQLQGRWKSMHTIGTGARLLTFLILLKISRPTG